MLFRRPLALEWFRKAHASNSSDAFLLRYTTGAYALKGGDGTARGYRAEPLRV